MAETKYSKIIEEILKSLRIFSAERIRSSR